MEAVRTRPAASSDELVLPPPPAPFPVDLLERRVPPATVEARQRTNEALANGNHQDHATPDLASVQASCVHALSLLIPDSPTMPSAPLPPLSFHDSQLAQALTELLEVSYDLEALHPGLVPPSPTIAEPSQDFERLMAEMTRLQELASHRHGVGRTNGQASQLHPTIGIVREELAWARVDALSHAVIELVAERSSTGQTNGHASRGSMEERPPAYWQDDVGELPSYEGEGSTSNGKAAPEKTNGRHHDEDRARAEGSMPREKEYAQLDTLTSAIERAQGSSSRLEDQRCEPRSTLSSAEAKARMERDKMRELDEIFRLIEKSYSRRKDQTRVDVEELEARRTARRRRYLEDLLDQGEGGRLEGQDAAEGSKEVNPELARARELKNRDRFLQDLVVQGEGGRMQNQDADGSRQGTMKDKQNAFFDNLVDQTQSSRYQSQDYPLTLADRIESKRRSMIDSLLDYSGSGRLHDQDSAPPTSKTATMRDPRELVTINDFFREGKDLPESSTSGSRTRSGSGASEGGDEKKQGTLSRIAGLVRRRSMGLTLKAQASDFGSASYVAEHQENLLAVQVMLHGVGVSLKDELVLSTDGTIQAGCGVSEATITSKRDPSLSMRIALPAPVTVGQSCTFAVSDLHLEAKLSALPTATTTATLAPAYALSATELRKIKPKALCCTACDREVADLARALRSEAAAEGSGIKDLPSEHWAEMLEVWMCHDDPAFTAQLAQRTTEGFWPTKDNLLVGGSYLLVHPDSAKPPSLNVELSNNDSWAVVKCACGEVLGKKRGKEDKYGAGTLKFSKWAVALLREDEDEESVEPVRYPFSVFIMSDLLELVQAHATFRFVISDEATSAPKLLMWIFNPSVGLTYRQAEGAPMPSPLRQSSSASSGRKTPNLSRRMSSASSGAGGKSTGGGVKTVKAAKVLYKVLDAGLHSDFVPGFGTTKGGQVEHASYPTEVVDMLIQALRESSTIYPAGRRTFLGLENGFLERI